MISTGVPAHLFSFKGKGEVRVRVRELERREEEIAVQMWHTVESFTASFRQPRPVHLVVHGQGGYRHLRWRVSRSGAARQTFLELVSSDVGRYLLTKIPISMREVLLEFERVRLALNLVSSVNQHELRRLREYLTKLESLQQQEKSL